MERLSLKEFQEKYGTFKEEEKFKKYLTDMNLNFEDFKNLVKFSNNENEVFDSVSKAKFNNYLVRKVLGVINTAIYGDYLLNASEIIDSENKLSLKSNFILLNNFLQGGFKPGKIYQLYGPSLSGKSFFISNLINTKTHHKFVFFDTNNSFNPCKINRANHEEYITHINIFDFKELINYLNSFSTSMPKIDFIIIDSLSLVANKITLNKNKDYELQTEFNYLINKFVNHHKIGVIFTTCPNKIKDKLYHDFKEPGNCVFLKELHTSLAPGVVIPVDYTLNFLNPHFNFRIDAFRSRKFYLKVEQEKGGLQDKLIQLD